MFHRLDAPADLGSARAQLMAEADRLAGPSPVQHLQDPSNGPGPGLGLGAQVAKGGGSGAGVVVADSVLWRAAPAELEALGQALGPERPLLFLEPTADRGWRRLAHRIGRSVWRRLAGHDFEADLPVRLRAAGFEVVDLRRFGAGRAGVRSYAAGRAIIISSR